MKVKIGDKVITAESDVIMTFKNNSIMIVDISKTKFLYINADEVKTVNIGRKQNKEMW